jgi:hypothetical protein
MADFQSMFESMKKQFGDAEANTGEGALGEWPEEGHHDCLILSLEANNDDTFFIDRENRIPATSFFFRYQLVEDPNSPDDPMRWRGAPFIFPHNPSSITAKNKLDQIRISRDRFCGHLQTILGTKVGVVGGIDLDQAIDAVATKLNGGTHTICTVRCEYRTRGTGDATRTYKTEYLQKLLAD